MMVLKALEAEVAAGGKKGGHETALLLIVLGDVGRLEN